MQEHKCIRGGACLAISLEGLERLSGRTGTDQEIKQSDPNRSGPRELGDPNNGMVPGQNQLRSVVLLRDRGSSSITRLTPSSVRPPPALDVRGGHSAFSTTGGSPWTEVMNYPDNVDYFRKNTNCDPEEQIVILCSDDILTRLLRDAFEGWEAWPVWTGGRCVNNNVGGVFRDRSNVSISGEARDHGQKLKISKEQPDSGGTGTSSGGIRRKSVSFADDVIVYLYDKDSPTKESHLESSSSLVPEISFDDNGLEWEDDFLALENNCQSRRHPGSRHSPGPPPTHNWTADEPGGVIQSQRCLFLTHVNESDLEP